VRYFKNIFRWLFVVCLPFLIITGSIAWACNSTWVYTTGFEKYGVQQTLAQHGLSLTQADFRDIARGFVRYFNSGEEYIHLTVPQDGRQVELFNEEEILHFKDVKGLFRLDYYVLLGTFLYCLIYAVLSLFYKRRKNRRGLAKSALTGSAITLGILLALGICSFFDFNWLFLQFHLLSFSNDFWSAEGNMLLLFPGGFWYDAVIYIGVFAAVVTVLLGAISWWYLRKSRPGVSGPDENRTT